MACEASPDRCAETTDHVLKRCASQKLNVEIVWMDAATVVQQRLTAHSYRHL